MKRLFLLAMLPMLLAPAEGGCVGSCNCPMSSVVYVGFPAALNVQLAATGQACSRQPHCDEAGDGGGCTEYDVPLTGSGSCHLTARAADGRQTSADRHGRLNQAGC